MSYLQLIHLIQFTDTVIDIISTLQNEIELRTLEKLLAEISAAEGDVKNFPEDQDHSTKISIDSLYKKYNENELLLKELKKIFKANNALVEDLDRISEVNFNKCEISQGKKSENPFFARVTQGAYSSLFNPLAQQASTASPKTNEVTLVSYKP